VLATRTVRRRRQTDAVFEIKKLWPSTNYTMLMQYVPLIFALAWAALIAKGLLTFDYAVKYAHGHLSL
jgi:hypothetical protein